MFINIGRLWSVDVWRNITIALLNEAVEGFDQEKGTEERRKFSNQVSRVHLPKLTIRE